MRAIFETLFDIVYLVTVVTIGIRMIRGSKGNRQFQLFGGRFGRRRFVPPGPSRAGTLHDGL